MDAISQLNATFLEILNDPQRNDQEKAAGLSKVATGIVRTFVEQEGFCGKIVPPELLTREQCIKDGLEGHLFVLRPIDGNKVYSIQTNRHGKPTGRYVKGKDYRIDLSYRTSEEIEKNTKDLQDTYTYDIQELFENRIALSLQRLQDILWMQKVWTSLGYNTATGDLNTSGSKQILDKRSYWGGSGKSAGLSAGLLVSAWQKFGSEVNATGQASQAIATIQSNFQTSQNPLIPATLLMNEYDFADFGDMPASEIGDILKAEFFDAYNKPMIKGLQIVRTIHQDIIPRGRLYIFTQPQFIGHNFEVDPIRVVAKVDSYENELKMKGEHFAGEGIGNIKAFWEVLFTPRDEENGDTAEPTVPVL